MKNSKNGFTLVELISVISLLLVLSVFAFVSYTNYSDAAKQEAMQTDANTLARAINHYNSVITVSEDRIEAAGNIVIDGDTFPLVAIGGENALVSSDLSVTVGAGRAGEVIDLLLWVPSQGGSGGMWTVEI